MRLILLLEGGDQVHSTLRSQANVIIHGVTIVKTSGEHEIDNAILKLITAKTIRDEGITR